MAMSAIHQASPRNGGAKRDRQKRRCEANIKEWTNLNKAASQKTVEDSGEIVMRSNLRCNTTAMLPDKRSEVLVKLAKC